MSELDGINTPRADVVGEAGYDPIRNEGLAEIVTDTPHDSKEYLRLLEFKSEAHKIGRRVLHIVYDNVIGIAPDEHTDLTLSRVNGDAIFVLNALLARRAEFQSMRQLVDFEAGFRGKIKHPDVEIKSISTHFGRVIHALDYISERSTGRIMVARTSWGSGALKGKAPPMYKVHDDITVIDARNPQQ